MAAKKSDDDIPSVPVPPSGEAVPPVEPIPAAPVAPVETPPAAAAPPASEPVNPYAAPSATPPAPGYAAAPPSPYGTPAYAPVAAGPAQGLSIASMITGIGGLLLSFAGFGFLPALAAVILGHLAQKRQPYAKPFWLTGIITGYVGIGISLIVGLGIAIAIIGAIIASSNGYYR